MEITMKTVSELMIPVAEYATVPDKATLLEAILILEKSQARLKANRQPYRAVLVTDKNNKIIGKIGHLAFLKALEPKYNFMDDMSKLTMAGVSTEFIESMMEHLSMWNDNIETISRRAALINVKNVMHPVSENIDVNASILEAIHKIVMWQTLSILVTKDNSVIGILRLSDIYEEVSGYIKKMSKVNVKNQENNNAEHTAD
jgi:CBS domain-containing protein